MGGLTARFVEGVKGEAGKRREIPDDVVRGLSLRVTETGAKSWALRYRNEAGQQKRLTIASFPAVSLSKARDLALTELAKVAVKEDPARQKQIMRQQKRRDVAEKPQTVSALWTIYELEVLPNKREQTRDFDKWLWEKHLKPRLGRNDLAGLDRGTVRAAIKEIGSKARVTANRSLGLLRAMMNWAVDEEYLKASPLSRMGALYKEESRDRVLNDAELKALWTALAEAPRRPKLYVSARLTIALKLILLTGTRANEVAGLNVSEIDRVARSWTIPAARSKNGREHVVPLSGDAWALVGAAFDDADPDKWSGPVFPNKRDAAAPLDRHSLTRAMARVREIAIIEGEKEPIARVTAHDLRRTCATYIASERIGVAPHVVSAVLGHDLGGPEATRVYNKHRYDAEKRGALEAWARLLKEIVGGKERPDNVTPLRAEKRA